jgi:hypothetical protein
MEDDEKAMLKAACIQAAVILLADQMQRPGHGTTPAPDAAACVRYARDPLEKVTGEAREDSPKTSTDPVERNAYPPTRHQSNT